VWTKQLFLESYSEVGTILGACSIVGVNRSTVRDWLKQDLEFAESFNASKDEFNDRIREEIHRRAIEVQYESAESTPTGN